MLNDDWEVGAALRRAGVQEGHVTTVPVPNCDEVIFSLPVSEPEADWLAALAAMPETGRYPVVVYEDETLGPSSALRAASHPAGQPPPDEIIADSFTVDLRQELDRRYRERSFRQDLDAGDVGRAASLTEQLLGTAPDAGEVLAALGPNGNHESLERWLFDWELSLGRARQSSKIRDIWENGALWQMSPPLDEPTSLYLLPTDQPWHVPAYLDLYAAYGKHHVLCAALREWFASYGARVRAFFGVQVDLQVERQPATPDEAWQVARDLSVYGAANYAALRHVAIAILDAHVWPLFERP